MGRLSQRALRAELVRLLKEQAESLDPTILKYCASDQMLDLRLHTERIKTLIRQLKLDGYDADQGPRRRNVRRGRGANNRKRVARAVRDGESLSKPGGSPCACAQAYVGV